MATPITESSSPPLAVSNEEYLTLKDGRTLAFSQNGDLTSTKIICFFHGVFGVGSASPYTNDFFQSRGYRFLAPTVPGFGRSSPYPTDRPLHAFVSDIAELIRHILKPDRTPTHLIFGGGSYGSIWAYACVANKPISGEMAIEPAEAIRGMFILGGFSPFRDHDGYTEGMTYMNWLLVGRPSRSFLFSWMNPFVGNIMKSKIGGSVDGAVQMLRSILTGPDAMTTEERALIDKWLAERGETFDEWELDMAKNMTLSVAETMSGYTECPKLLNDDWGFKMHELRVHRPGKKVSEGQEGEPLPVLSTIPSILPPIVIAGCVRDHMAPIAMQRWTASQIPGAQFIALEGNHISGITSFNTIIAAIVAGVEADDKGDS